MPAVPQSPRTQLKPPSAPANTGATAPSGRMKLAAVVKGRLDKPIRALLYGIEGVGKSTFAAGAPSPIFLGAEDGTSELDVARFPEPKSWLDALEAIDELARAQHDYKTLVIDTLDWLEPINWEHVCASKPTSSGKRVTDIEGFGFGKGYTAALDQWRVFVSKLENLRAQKRMHMILLAHSWIKSFKNPTGDDFDRYELKLHAKAGGLLKEWCDAVLFATHQTHTYERDGRVKGISDGSRVLYTQRTAAYDAKNRYDLPNEMALDWETFAAAVAAHRPADPATLKARINELLARVPDDTKTKVTTALKMVGDNAAELARIANRLSAMVNIAANEQGAQDDQSAEQAPEQGEQTTDTQAQTQQEGQST